MEFLFKEFFNLPKDFFLLLLSTDHLDLALALEPVHKGVSNAEEGIDTLFEGFRVVIHTSGAGTAGQSTLDHLVFGALEEEHELHIAAFHHLFVPDIDVFEVTGETIDDVETGLVLDVLLEELADQVGADQASFHLDLLNLAAELTALFGFLTEEFSGGMMMDMVFLFD